MIKYIKRILFAPFLGSKALNIGKEIVELARNSRRVLDFGCGDMFLTKYVSYHLPKAKITGIDVIDTNLTDLNPIIYSGRRLPFKDNQFDLGYAVFVLHHIESQKESLKELKRVAKKLVIVEEIYDNVFEKYLTYVHDWIVNRAESLSVNIPFTFHSDTEWKAIFKALNLKLTLEKRVFQLPFFNLTKQKLYFLEKIL